MPSFGFIPYMVSEKKIFKHFYENRPFWLPRQPIKFIDLDKGHMKHRGLLNKHFCKFFFKISPMRQKKLSISSFPIISSPEPNGSQGELIVYASSRRPSSVCPSVVHNAQTSSPQKPLGQSKPNSMWSLLG